MDKGRAIPKYENPIRLALHRFTTCTLTQRTSKYVPEITQSDNEALGVMLGKPFRVVIRFSEASATYVAERQWSADQRIVTHEDGSMTLSLQARDESECLAWVFSFGDTAEILEPQQLHEKFMKKLDNLQKIYTAHPPEEYIVV